MHKVHLTGPTAWSGPTHSILIVEKKLDSIS